MRKYTPQNLLPALRLFADARNAAVKAGFTDNGGAIHSVERILDILSMSIKYPHLSHINKLKADPTAEISKAARIARALNQQVYVEHVLPQRAYAQKIIELISSGSTDDQITEFIKDNYRLVVLSKEETTRINRINRSRITPDRIADADIEF